MDVMTVEHAYRLLESLVAIPSVNPMGRPHTGPVPIEKDVNDYIRDLLSPYGLQMERRACSARRYRRMGRHCWPTRLRLRARTAA